MVGAEGRLVLRYAKARGHPDATFAVHCGVVRDGRVVPIELLAPVRRRHRHRLRLARGDLRIQHRNAKLGGCVLQRIDDQEAVVAPVDAVDGPERVGRRIALVRRQLVVGERCPASPVPHGEHQVPLESLGPWGGRGHLARADTIAPVREHLQGTTAPQGADRAAHVDAVLTGLHPAVPGVDALCEGPKGFRELARGLVAHLMTHVAVHLDLTDPVMLRLHLGVDAVASGTGPRKLRFRGNRDQGIPVVGRIESRGRPRIGSHDGRESELLASSRSYPRGVHQSVSTRPHAESGFGREIWEQVAPLVVRHHDLAKLGRCVAGFGDHPDAGFWATRYSSRPRRYRPHRSESVPRMRTVVERREGRVGSTRPKSKRCPPSPAPRTESIDSCPLLAAEN